MNDSEAMQQALLCAAQVEGRTSPRPPVGAVVVQADRVLGQGATAPPYGPHAEVVALAEAGAAARGATLYVSLEPCCITIHTPPCTQAIIAAGIKRVVIGTLDPNPQVAGRGMAQLHEAGIETSCLHMEQASELMRPFATFITKKRPYVTAKWAMTLDGKLATGSKDAHWISGPESRAWVHDLRDRVDAILIGSQTAIQDNPQLTVRLPAVPLEIVRTPRAGPLRVVLAAHGLLPETLQLLQEELAMGTWVIVGENCSAKQRRWLEERGVKVQMVAADVQGHVDFAAALQLLHDQGYMHALIEGGSQLLGSAFDARLVDRVAAFIAPKIIGGATAPTPVGGTGLGVMSEAWQLSNREAHQFGNDIFITGNVLYADRD
ncbi:riboflavin biosynthesis protein RibD [Dictyobacter alpinus]|uniref:Riboflavin biosynthesis protein RibD n=1 Tax=Dictyobacter alpinus TaxID=2014873 RepID=A0A402BBE6_9CHLR|nr:bifunctional diaminohydroxyphosphoribosylaminopyrimidine deaminase/5-amino-6-(5-phosphoribosylamino)uracil reductase RibD [Dictyobacter alpinus]GCE28636.1 riboflavin biosynthesis protein RibD [Dictyobacter alpinus]